MIAIVIGDSSRTFASPRDIEERWINEQFNLRKRDTRTDPCVKVHLQVGGLDLRLATCACSLGGGGRAPNFDEQRVLDLWRKLHLDDSNVSGGDLVAFVKQSFALFG